jgi:hypothetical protein
MAHNRYRVLVIGGYGTFASPICAALAGDPHQTGLAAIRAKYLACRPNWHRSSRR